MDLTPDYIGMSKLKQPNLVYKSFPSPGNICLFFNCESTYMASSNIVNNSKIESLSAPIKNSPSRLGVNVGVR